MTLICPLLNHAPEVAFLVSGEGKSEILRDVIKPSRPMSYPAQSVRPTNGRLLWIVTKQRRSCFDFELLFLKQGWSLTQLEAASK